MLQSAFNINLDKQAEVQQSVTTCLGHATAGGEVRGEGADGTERC
ncbi:hypothetical protein E2C01_098865 [Portunus trituberculatus]|uniref:Uncharacterized protein n=1 Tax=Portunus trituberculatus TaxID=210409 RepID=A0A5B7K2B9_PORTR|nr:hypothetical protein [Portunus trituberculatus]